MFIEIDLHGIAQIKLAPFVNSIIPEVKAVTNLKSCIPKTLKIGLKIWAINVNMWLLFRIDNITLKSTTKPPIITTVLIADIMLLLSTSPKFDKCTVHEVLEARLVW